ncbi:hypothetical protein RFI_15821 [Reticulomyxa filosa]|uniref:Uncharacterized protein n=1 Tax=Reticulomyxa filosa TaxID=46433 RepID=X6N656_RETFI|nr:hypothetical protein RFI_15821 [Reticulomyxa filosa]|eukprot:ETO21383.1 hypothetical protein RFI_15821 [Reticulomyxa filosa]
MHTLEDTLIFQKIKQKNNNDVRFQLVKQIKIKSYYSAFRQGHLETSSSDTERLLNVQILLNTTCKYINLDAKTKKQLKTPHKKGKGGKKKRRQIFGNFVFGFFLAYLAWDKTMATIRPYKPKASAKIKIKIIPTNNAGCCPFALTPASPTMPIAMPAPKADNPTLKPLAK